ncbi:MAG: potassium/proton antiporter [Rhodocyclaceae bacterium]|nr:potassium/proton antiporter [Rhodocyclaceae bacterium]MCB1912237.1 potassium/proton antiporter [Rhodocyclaceae bacterium]MCP5239706.1 potassium/proton antiporter [Zoogloeaceae bacterium]MCP5256288.1 potassium/proton antiporter [Zoogloeaceae bacterium]MCW5615699.1 potassium/proton antiporter [Rhodocyclaceae bacterium]
MTAINGLFLLAGLLLFVSVLASTVSARLGLPLLLLFLVVGMLAGEDGPGGIRFDDFAFATLVGHLALAVILLDGGLRTRVSSFRVALWPAAVLASWGVVATALVLGLFATWLMDIDWRMGMLLAAIVGSTDAAAVFALLRNSGVRLNERVKATLEIESGANDPMAILLVTVLVEMLLTPEKAGFGRFMLMLVAQLGIGVLFGGAGGWVLRRLLTRMRLAEGLYALLIVSGGLLIFAAANLIGGSGFLAVYLAGLMVGNSRCHATEHVLRVMDGLAWLAQAGMFLVLGLLVTPSHLLESLPHALVMAVFLMLVARPLAVLSGLLPFRYQPREIGYVAWVGLRGAVPIVLAIVPVTMGIPDSRLLFDVAFAVVLVSLLIQGATVPVAARWLKIEVPASDEPVDRREVWVGDEASLDLLEYRVAAGANAQGRHPDEVAAEVGGISVRCVSLVRGGRIQPLRLDTRLREGDSVWFVASDSHAERLARLFNAGAGDELSAHAGFFGEFVVDPACPASALVSNYGVSLPQHEVALPLRELIRVRLGRALVVGDRLSLGGLVLTVRDIDERGTVTQIGLKCPVLTRPPR